MQQRQCGVGQAKATTRAIQPAPSAMVNAMSGVMPLAKQTARQAGSGAQKRPDTLSSAQGEQVGDQRVDVRGREPEHEAARHGVALPRDDVRAGVGQGLPEVVRGGPGAALLGDGTGAGELRTESPALAGDVVAPAAVEGPIQLAAAGDGLGRWWLGAGDEAEHGDERDAPQDPPPHHATVEDRAALRGATVVLDDRTVLRGIDLTLEPGVTVIRGRNGAGKTTLLRALAGLVPLARGSRVVGGDVLYLGHRPQLHRALSASENLAFFARYRGRPAAGVTAALAAWGVTDAARPVERLSAGQRRRASLARLDVERCPVVLLDEPFAELDDEAFALLAERIAALEAGGQAVLIATHAHEELARYRTVHLDAGTLVP